MAGKMDVGRLFTTFSLSLHLNIGNILALKIKRLRENTLKENIDLLISMVSRTARY